MSGGVFGVGHREVSSFLRALGFERVAGKGDHEVYERAGHRIEVCCGGKWNKCQPKVMVKKIAAYLCTSAHDAVRRIQAGS